MGSTPLVSLLVPTYNSALTVAEAIQSCRDQTFKDIEILVYDEVSRDGTREIIADQAKQDPRIRYSCSDTNSGPVKAWRKLLYEARGKYFTWVWADDLILPRFVETMVSALEKNPSHLLTGCNAFSELLPETVEKKDTPKIVTGEKSRHPLHQFPSVTVKGDEYALGVLAAVFPVSQICLMYRIEAAKKVFDNYINFENPYGFDFSKRAYGNEISFHSELALRAGEISLNSDCHVVCRASPDSMTVNARRHHRWQYWLQYVWAIRHAWTRCRDLSPRMDALIRVVDDRVSFCEFFYSLQHKRLPREFNPIKMARALWFLKTEDKRLNPNVGPASIQAYLARHAK